MSFGGTPDPLPPPPPPAPAPEPDDTEVLKAAEDERRRLRAARGRAANALTGGQGVQGPATTNAPSAANQLLGL